MADRRRAPGPRQQKYQRERLPKFVAARGNRRHNQKNPVHSPPPTSNQTKRRPQNSRTKGQSNSFKIKSQSTFFNEPFFPRDPKTHFHDAYGETDFGVDYGPPTGLELEEGDDDDDDDGGETNAEDELSEAGLHKDSVNSIRVDKAQGKEVTLCFPKQAAANTVSSTVITDVTLEELEEEVGLHESTLESLNTKLAKLKSDIEEEERSISAWRNSIQLLNEKKIKLKKRSEHNVQLVKELEVTIEKCLERLRRVLDVGKKSRVKDLGKDDKSSSNFMRLQSKSSDSDRKPTKTCSPNVKVRTMRSDGIAQKNDKSTLGEVKSQCNDAIVMDSSRRSYDDPFSNEVHFTFEESVRCRIVWPPPTLVEGMQREVKKLPCYFPSWRTGALSMSLLPGMDSSSFILDVLNVATLERLLEREVYLATSTSESSLFLSEGCGWVNERNIWGTCLDVFSQVNWTHLFSGFQRMDGSGGPSQDIIEAKSVKIDPNLTLCPYELGGTCADNRCLYQHLQKSCRETSRSEENFAFSSSNEKTNAVKNCRYFSLPSPRLPRVVTEDELVKCFEQREEANFLSIESSRRKTSAESALTDSSKSEQLQGQSQEDYSYHNADNADFTENDDFISLPHLDEKSDNDDDSTAFDCEEESTSSEFFLFGTFWWQQVSSFSESGRRNNFHGIFCRILAIFGFDQCFIRRYDKHNCEEGVATVSLRNREEPKDSMGLGDITLVSRLVDFARICIHCGYDSFALETISSFMDSADNSGLNRYNSELISHASRTVSALSSSRCAYGLFRCQVELLLLSECCRAHSNVFNENKSRLVDDTMKCVSSFILPEKLSWKDHAPNGFHYENRMQSLLSRLPKTRSQSSAKYPPSGLEDEWADFETALQLLMEKHFFSPSSRERQFSFLLRCIYLGYFFEELCKMASEEHDFSSCLHVLDPIWRSMHRFLQPRTKSDGLDSYDFSGKHMLALVLLGPIIFACVADTIASPMTTHNSAIPTSKKNSPTFDSRILANLSYVEKVVIGISKEITVLNQQSERKDLIELLLTPIQALIVASYVAQGAYNKAQQRLEHLLNADSFAVNMSRRSVPTMYSISEILWSQLVQLRMACPSITAIEDSTPFIKDDKSLIPATIVESNKRIAACVSDYEVVLRSVSSCGDPTLIPYASRISKWEDVLSHLFKIHTGMEKGRTIGDLSCLEVDLSDLSSNEFYDTVQFPESLLLIGKDLARLTMTNCNLKALPLSIGYRFSNLVLLDVSENSLNELPSSVCRMVSLEVLILSKNHLKSLPQDIMNCNKLRVIDVSYNLLENFPGSLALHLPLLQSFLVEGNPALSSVDAVPRKRQKFEIDTS